VRNPHPGAIFSHVHSRLATDNLAELEPEERNRIYKMLNLMVLAHVNDNLEVKWLSAGTLVEITQLYFSVVPYLQPVPTGSALCSLRKVPS
jgi:hypothetical protein